MKRNNIFKGIVLGICLLLVGGMTGCTDILNNDVDYDGIPNDEDNCPQSYNPEQVDSDDDGIGDECDSCNDPPDEDEDEDCRPKYEMTMLNLDTLNRSIGTWNSIYFIAYELPDHMILKSYNLSLSKVDDWSGMNQVLFWMVGSDIPVPNREMYWLRKSINTTVEDPWHLEDTEDTGRKASGEYFIVGLTNNHEFELDGDIEGYLKVGCW